MRFPVYYGIDMTDEDEGITEISFALNDGTTLKASGAGDWFSFEHFRDFGGLVKVNTADIIADLNKEAYEYCFGDCIRKEESRL